MKTTFLSVAAIVFAISIPSTSLPGEPDHEKDTRPFCKTVDEAAKWVLSQRTAEQTLQFAHIHSEGLIHLHHGFGTWIRNSVPVWGNKPLRESVGTNIHADDVGARILHKYWLLARNQLPKNERKRIEFFEKTLPGLKGSKPKGETQAAVIKELNSQIKTAWPKDAAYRPYTLVADKGTHFNWEPKEMGDSLKKNVVLFLAYHRSLPFYDGDSLRVGDYYEKQKSDEKSKTKR